MFWQQVPKFKIQMDKFRVREGVKVFTELNLKYLEVQYLPFRLEVTVTPKTSDGFQNERFQFHLFSSLNFDLKFFFSC